MHRALVGILFATACTVEPIDFSNKSCPCAPGYDCIQDRCHLSGGTNCKIRIDDFRASWAAATTIRWEWAPVGEAADFLEYALVVAETAEDLEQTSGTARVFGAEQNPEIGGFMLQRSGGEDLVTASMTDGHQPNKPYVAQLRVTDRELCEHRSAIAAQSTQLDPPAEIILFRDDPVVGFAIPDGFVRTPDATGGGHHLAFVTEQDPECIQSGDSTCHQNLRYQGLDLDLSDISPGELANTALFEVAVASDAQTPSFYSRVWLAFDDCGQRFQLEPWTVRTNGQYRVLQVPLRVLTSERTLVWEDLQPSQGGSSLCGFNIGGQWQRGSTVRVDNVRIRY